MDDWAVEVERAAQHRARAEAEETVRAFDRAAWAESVAAHPGGLRGACAAAGHVFAAGESRCPRCGTAYAEVDL